MIRTILGLSTLAFLLSSFTGCDSVQPSVATGQMLCGTELDLTHKQEGLQGNWSFKGFSSGGMLVATCKPEAIKEMSLEFKSGGILQGTSSCNSLSGEYAGTEGKLQLSGIGFTEMLCGEGEGQVMTWERHFQKGLQGTIAFEITGNSLQLKTNNNNDLFFLLAEE